MLLALAVSASGCHSPGASSSGTTGSGALVEIYSSRQESPVCQGVPVALTERAMAVLTAAHCVRAAASGGGGTLSPGTLRARRAGGPEHPLLAVRRLIVHPLFEDVGPNSVYDFALLETDRDPGVDSTPWMAAGSSALSQARLMVSSGRASPDAAAPLTLLDETPLTFTFRAPPGAVCQGQSGAPVLDGATTPPRLLGIISHGARDCRENATAGKLSAIGGGFLTTFLDPSSPAPVEESCAACTERVGVGDRCHIALSRCRDDDSCRRLLDCELACTNADCQHGCAEGSPQALALAESLRRCVCAGGCRASCGVECEASRGCGLSVRDPSCHGCLEQHCCAESRACSREPACVACSGRGDDCPGGVASAELNHCIEQHCQRVCLSR